MTQCCGTFPNGAQFLKQLAASATLPCNRVCQHPSPDSSLALQTYYHSVCDVCKSIPAAFHEVILARNVFAFVVISVRGLSLHNWKCC